MKSSSTIYILRKSCVESKYSVIIDCFLVYWEQKLEWKDEFRSVSLIIIYSYIFYMFVFLYSFVICDV